MPAVKPVMLLVKEPVPLPSIVLKFAIVGLGVVFQQTPRAVIAAPPSAVMLPPLMAVVPVIVLTAVVPPITATVAVGVGVGVDGDLLHLPIIKKCKDRGKGCTDSHKVYLGLN